MSHDSGNRDSHSTGLPKHDQIDAARASLRNATFNVITFEVKPKETKSVQRREITEVQY